MINIHQANFVYMLGKDLCGMSRDDVTELCQRDYNKEVIDLLWSEYKVLTDDLIRWRCNPLKVSDND